MKRFMQVLVMFLFFIANGCDDNASFVSQSDERGSGLVVPPKPLKGLFVDPNAKESNDSGSSWENAAKTIKRALYLAKGQDIYIAPGVYKESDMVITSENIRLVAGYTPGEKFEKIRTQFPVASRVIFEGNFEAKPIFKISGKTAKNISFDGGFEFKNVSGTSAIIIEGESKDNPVYDIRFKNCFFTDNTNDGTVKKGGGIRAINVSGINIDDVTANNNSAEHGGFFYGQGIKNFSIRGLKATNNIASYGGGMGGAVFLQDANNFSFANVEIENNSGWQGAGFYLKDVLEVSFNNASFLNNNNIAKAGRALGMYVEGSKLLTGTGLSIKGHESGAFPAALEIIMTDGRVNIDFNGKEIANNKQTGKGAVAIQGLKQLTLKNGNFNNNKGAAGGALHITDVKEISLENIIFNGNDSTGNGGALYVENLQNSSSMKDLVFEDNKAHDHGGAISILDEAPQPGAEGTTRNIKLNILSCSFKNNEAQNGNGGAVFTKHIPYEIIFTGERKLKFEDKKYITTFIDNKAINGFGGALALDLKSFYKAKTIIDDGVLFAQNSSSINGGGGGIYGVFRDGVAINPSDRALVINNKTYEWIRNSVNVGGLGTYARGERVSIANQNIEINLLPAPGAPWPQPFEYYVNLGAHIGSDLGNQKFFYIIH